MKKVFFVCVCLAVSFITDAKLRNDYSHYKIKQAHALKNVKLTPAASTAKTDFSFDVNGESYTFELEDNKRLIKSLRTKKSSNEWTLLRGRIVGKDDSWARFSVRDNKVQGAFFDGQQLYLVEQLDKVYGALASNSLHGANKAMRSRSDAPVIIKPSDIEHNGTCAMHAEHSNLGSDYDAYVSDLQAMTQDADSQINLTLVADVEFANNSSDAEYDMLSSLNFADGVFTEQLGIRLSLSESIVLTDNGSFTSTNALNLLQSLNSSSIPNSGLRHLFTGKNLDGSTVGIAYIGQLCNQYSTGVTQRYGALTSLIFTHELGHNFGSPHDNQSGSECQSTGSGYVMNPNVNGAGSQFSACSVSEILPVLNYYKQRVNSCIAPVSVVVPEITSTPNLSAELNTTYMYDSDGIVDVQADSEVTFLLDIAPEGMTIDSQGLISWEPQATDTGTIPVQITVQNADGSDSQYFEINVAVDNEFINFNETPISSYGGQDQTGQTIVSETGYQIELVGNNWKSIDFNYTVTPQTILEFEFKSDVVAEIHGIGFDNDNFINPSLSFALAGTQNWGQRQLRYTQVGEFVTFQISVGQFYTGNFNRLFMLADNDRNIANANSVFKNVKVYEGEQSLPEMEYFDLNLFDITAFSSEQDRSGSTEIIESGLGIKLSGNKWQRMIVEGRQITPNTVLQFDFKSTRMGDIHGIGFMTNSSVDSSKSFQVLGTQNWGNNASDYLGQGDYQTISIPVGSYLTSDEVHIIFINDHDVASPDATSYFKNISLYEAN